MKVNGVKKKSWSHHKHGKNVFIGTYEKVKNERVLNLTSEKKSYTFESWQMAKQLGWKAQ